MIDLHTHSTFSDGSLSPEALAGLGAEIGLTALALTDHDTLDGVPRFLAACSALTAGPRGIAGVELSAEVPRGTVHILGYGVDPQHSELADALHQLREGRGDRNAKILKKLGELGAEISHEDVLEHAGEQVVGRPHFARALVARGHVANKTEAFDKLLGKGAPAYVPRFRLAPELCIRLIRSAGGVAVLAHPFTVDSRPNKLRAEITSLVQAGLQGIEVFYSEHGPERQAFCEKLAGSLGLLMTGGSDYHGELNPDIKLGRGFGGLCVPDELADALL